MRLLTCSACEEELEVYEEPVEFLDPVSYVCGQCREAGHSQLALTPDDPEPQLERRSETLPYDPARAALPY